ncbi:MAG: hypothetical protein D6679_02675 [Candidatus Hydrogenedentota bacterium]|nr:MAG: hypothetical protein D6679_02675 [Candidatus Hydrogenedentota bacterium]
MAPPVRGSVVGRAADRPHVARQGNEDIGVPKENKAPAPIFRPGKLLARRGLFFLKSVENGHLISSSNLKIRDREGGENPRPFSLSLAFRDGRGGEIGLKGGK